MQNFSNGNKEESLELYNIGRMSIELNKIRSLVREVSEEFPILNNINIFTMTYVEVLRMLSDHLESIRQEYHNSHTEELDLYFSENSPQPRPIELVLLLLLLYIKEIKTFSIRFKKASTSKVYPADFSSLKIINDNSISMSEAYSEDIIFFCSVDSALCHSLLYFGSELQKLDQFLCKKMSESLSMYNFFIKRNSGVNINNQQKYKSLVEISMKKFINSKNDQIYVTRETEKLMARKIISKK